MRRIIGFVLVIACGIGLLTGSAWVIDPMHTGVEYTQQVISGDPARAEGQKIRLTTNCGDQLFWYTDLTLGEALEYTTEFQLYQDSQFPEEYRDINEMSAYPLDGMGTSGMTELGGGEGTYAPLARAVAAVTGPGEYKSMNLRVADYLEYFPLNFSIHYSSGQEPYLSYYEYISVADLLYAEAESAEMILEAESPTYAGLRNLFRFPVPEDHIMEVGVQKDMDGSVIGLDFSGENLPEVGYASVLNDRGIYFVPIYRDWNYHNLEGLETPEGFGLYFLPWKQVQTGNYTELRTDVSGLELLYPMDEETVILHIAQAKNDSQIRLLTLEDGKYVFTALAAENGQVLSRLEIGEADPEAVACSVASWSDELLATLVGDQLALITDDGQPKLEFVVPAADSGAFLNDFEYSNGAVKYDGQELTLAATPWRTTGSALELCVYDAQGLQYHGQYLSSLLLANERSYSSGDWVKTEDWPPVLE